MEKNGEWGNEILVEGLRKMKGIRCYSYIKTYNLPTQEKPSSEETVESGNMKRGQLNRFSGFKSGIEGQGRKAQRDRLSKVRIQKKPHRNLLVCKLINIYI